MKKILKMSEILKMTIGSGVPVLITGDKGSGKTFIAKEIAKAEQGNESEDVILIDCQRLSKREQSIQDFLDESQLDLKTMKSIVFKEVTLLNLSNQEQLLKILRETSEQGPRVLASSSISLEEQVQKGVFKQDLYYRLYVLHVELPCLDKRKEDLESIVRNILMDLGKENDYESSLEKVNLAYRKGKLSWEDNISGLKDFLKNKFGLRNHVDEQDSSFHHSSVGEKPVESKIEQGWLKHVPKGLTLKELETFYILEVLKGFENNRTHTAKALGISLRTLRNKINLYRSEGYKVS